MISEEIETCKAVCKKYQAYNSASKHQTPILSQLIMFALPSTDKMASPLAMFLPPLMIGGDWLVSYT